LIRTDGDVSAGVVIIASASNVGLVEDVECFSYEAEGNSFVEKNVFLEPEIERTEGAVEVDVCRDVLKLSACKTGK
jgi:hypothetical protein